MLTTDEIRQFIEEDMSSNKKTNARMGERYYDGEHDILQYRMFYYNADGKLVEDTTRTNMKIPHPFFTELVDQEVQYMLSNLDYVKSTYPELQTRLEEYFNEDFNAELQECMTDAASKGFGYIYTYTKSDGKLGFQYADCMGVVEVRAKETDDGCEYVIYWYVDRVGKENKIIKRIQVWTENETYFYVQEDDGEIEKDEKEKLNPRPHITYRKANDDAIYYDGFGYIPFFRLDNNRKQLGNLNPIKALIDDYDIMSCGLSNNLADFDHPLHVVRGFKGDNLDELQRNLKTKKIVGTSTDGGVEVHTVDIPYQARQVKMQEDEKNIYRFGMGFNSAQLGDGNVTNVVIKSRYALLDLKCNKLEIKLKQFLNKILKVVLEQINEFDGTNYQTTDVWFEFDREVMTNAQDNATIEMTKAQKRQVDVNTLLSLENVLDNDTIIKQICDVLDLDYEEIKDNLPEQEEAYDDVTNAENTLDDTMTDEETDSQNKVLDMLEGLLGDLDE